MHIESDIACGVREQEVVAHAGQAERVHQRLEHAPAQPVAARRRVKYEQHHFRRIVMPGARGLGAQPFVDAENAQNLAGGLDSALREHEPRQRVPRVDPMRVERAPMVQRIDAPHDQGDRLAVQFGDERVGGARQTVLPVRFGRQQTGPLIEFGIPGAAHQVDQRRIVIPT